ncbi:acetyl-CoA carboxylase biotin carboxyl carrier protein [Thermoflavimicrobium dichotomicum]|uniref:Biotin carboxyl carrier protein of acetyl-CoA carboxylase n=1 Tax=Thermoflavimicrobium dichotomicum TaxID=46223 RepID=A0A1I3QBV3_9BACL|nr:acetyl-CoA carboxylase biotin carboxyl carrier protein [Thermoflavimicrobium dichotomicum]SFJ31170.1 acetyl-CoA carboxylase biotin carboxyl carrier protein [Thermoflavimicrobium dichotomicum]
MSLKMHEIRELIRLVDESQIEEFEIDKEGTKVVIKKTSGRAQIATAPVQETPLAVSTQSVAPSVSAVATTPAVQPTAIAEPAPAPTPASPAVEDEANLHKIVSPMVGTFYRAPAPDADPYVKEGDVVDEKTIVCIVEAMKLMNEIEAEVRGTIVKVLVENGQLVEYGQPLFLVKTS